LETVHISPFQINNSKTTPGASYWVEVEPEIFNFEADDSSSSVDSFDSSDFRNLRLCRVGPVRC
jgi:hypothetical protein